MYLLIAAVLSKPVNAVSALFARRPIGSIIFGILMLGVLPFLLTLLTLSIIGVPFMLLALSLLFPLAILGKAAIFLTIGGTPLFRTMETARSHIRLCPLFHGNILAVY